MAGLTMKVLKVLKKGLMSCHRRWNEKMDRPFPLFDGASSHLVVANRLK